MVFLYFTTVVLFGFFLKEPLCNINWQESNKLIKRHWLVLLSTSFLKFLTLSSYFPDVTPILSSRSAWWFSTCCVLCSRAIKNTVLSPDQPSNETTAFSMKTVPWAKNPPQSILWPFTNFFTWVHYIYPQKAMIPDVWLRSELWVHVNTIYPSPVESMSGQQQVLSTYWMPGTCVMVKAVNETVSFHILGVRKQTINT